MQDCQTMNARARRISTDNKEKRQFCQSSRCPDASTTCPLHCITFNNGLSERTVNVVKIQIRRLQSKQNGDEFELGMRKRMRI